MNVTIGKKDFEKNRGHMAMHVIFPVLDRAFGLTSRQKGGVMSIAGLSREASEVLRIIDIRHD